MTRFSKAISELRVSRGLSQRDAAKRFFCGHGTISQLETGAGNSRYPKLRTIAFYANAYGATKDELIMLVMAALDDVIDDAGYEFK